MKIYLTVLLTCLCLSASFGQKKCAVVHQVLKACLNDLDLTESILKPRYNNKNLMELINERGIYLHSDSLFNALLNDAPIYIKIEGYKFEAYLSEKCLKKQAGRSVACKIPKPTLEAEALYVYSISSPIFSVNEKIACVYLNTYCGPLCGSGSLFFLKLEGKTWIVFQHKIIFVS